MVCSHFLHTMVCGGYIIPADGLEMDVVVYHMNEQIESILENFNFEDVQTVMKACPGRFWTSHVNPGEVPSINELKAHARKWLEAAANNKDCSYMACGGFIVLRDLPEEGSCREYSLELIFAVDRWAA